jgi:hypothetical protein
LRPLPTVSITGELLHLITLTSSFNFVPHPSFQATGAPPPVKSRAGRRCLPPGAEIRPSLLLPAAGERTHELLYSSFTSCSPA